VTIERLLVVVSAFLLSACATESAGVSDRTSRSTQTGATGGPGTGVADDGQIFLVCRVKPTGGPAGQELELHLTVDPTHHALYDDSGKELFLDVSPTSFYAQGVLGGCLVNYSIDRGSGEIFAHCTGEEAGVRGICEKTERPATKF